jgi:hypothetical protein
MHEVQFSTVGAKVNQGGNAGTTEGVFSSDGSFCSSGLDVPRVIPVLMANVAARTHTVPSKSCVRRSFHHGRYA